jgi:hypothetical protein
MGHVQFGKEGLGEIFAMICLFNYGLISNSIGSLCNNRVYFKS